MVLKFWDIDNGKVTYLKHTNNKNESRIIKLVEPTEPDRIPMSKMEDVLDLVFGLVSSIKRLDNVDAVNGGKDNNVNTKPGNNVEDDTGNNVEAVPEAQVDVRPKTQVDARPEVQIEAKPEAQIEAKPYVNIEPWVKVSLFSKEYIDPWVKGRVEKEKNVEAGQDERIETEQEKRIGTRLEKWAWEEDYDKDNGKKVPKEVSDKLNLLLQDDRGKRDGPQFLISKNKEKGMDTGKSPLSISNS